MAIISQREARRLQKRVSQLMRQEQERRRAWSQEWSGGVDLGSWTWPEGSSAPDIIRTARKLGHAVVVFETGRTIRFVALPHPSEDI